MCFFKSLSSTINTKPINKYIEKHNDINNWLINLLNTQNIILPQNQQLKHLYELKLNNINYKTQYINIINKIQNKINKINSINTTVLPDNTPTSVLSPITSSPNKSQYDNLTEGIFKNDILKPLSFLKTSQRLEGIPQEFLKISTSDSKRSESPSQLEQINDIYYYSFLYCIQNNFDYYPIIDYMINKTNCQLDILLCCIMGDNNIVFKKYSNSRDFTTNDYSMIFYLIYYYDKINYLDYLNFNNNNSFIPNTLNNSTSNLNKNPTDSLTSSVLNKSTSSVLYKNSEDVNKTTSLYKIMLETLKLYLKHSYIHRHSSFKSFSFCKDDILDSYIHKNKIKNPQIIKYMKYLDIDINFIILVYKNCNNNIFHKIISSSLEKITVNLNNEISDTNFCKLFMELNLNLFTLLNNYLNFKDSLNLNTKINFTNKFILYNNHINNIDIYFNILNLDISIVNTCLLHNNINPNILNYANIFNYYIKNNKILNLCFLLSKKLDITLPIVFFKKYKNNLKLFDIENLENNFDNNLDILKFLIKQINNNLI